MALSLFTAVILQVALLLLQSDLPWRLQVQVAMVGIALATLVHQLWQYRRLWSPHLDMLLLMTAFGGLGMVLAGLPDWGAPACHRELASWSRMAIVMCVAGGAPAWFRSRCLQEAKQERRASLYLLIDCAGMLAGMALSYGTVRWPLPFHYASMNVGMLLGMTLTMRLRPRLLGLYRRIKPDLPLTPSLRNR